MKRKVIICIVGGLLAIGAVGSTMAYFYVNASSEHSYNIGYNTLETIDDITKVTFSRYASNYYNYNSYKNNGVVDCVVRAKVNLNNYNYKDLIKFNIGSNWELVQDSTRNETETSEPSPFKRDAWYYYKGVVKVGESTSALLSNIKTLNNNNNNSKANIIIYAESVEYTEDTATLEQVVDAFKSIEYPSYLKEGD